MQTDYNPTDMVVIQAGQLMDIIGNAIDSKMEQWVQKKIEMEIKEKQDEQTMLTIKEVCAMYKVSRSTVYYKTEDGSIPCSRIGKKKLIRKADIDKALANGTISTGK